MEDFKDLVWGLIGLFFIFVVATNILPKSWVVDERICNSYVVSKPIILDAKISHRGGDTIGTFKDKGHRLYELKAKNKHTYTFDAHSNKLKVSRANSNYGPWWYDCKEL